MATRALCQVRGGLEAQLSEIAGWLIHQGHDVSVLSLDETVGDCEVFYDLYGAAFHRLGSESPHTRSSFSQRVRRQFRLFKFLRSQRPDIVLAFQQGMTAALGLPCRVLGIPLVGLERSAPSMYRGAGWKRRILFGSLMLAHSLVVQREEFVTGYPRFLRARIVVIPNWVRELGGVVSQGPAGRFVFAGRLDFPKEAPLLVQGFLTMVERYPGAHLSIYGSGPDRGAIEALLEASPPRAAARVELLEPVSSPAQFLNGQSCLVSVSRWEGSPNTVLEALAADIPVAALDCYEGIANLIEDHINGWIVPGPPSLENVVTLLSKAMAGLQSDEILLGSCADSVSNYDKQAIGPLWSALIRSLA